MDQRSNVVRLTRLSLLGTGAFIVVTLTLLGVMATDRSVEAQEVEGSGHALLVRDAGERRCQSL